MPSPRPLPIYAVSGFSADSFSIAETAFSFWSDMFRSSSDFAIWWTHKWLELPSAFLAIAPLAAEAAAKPVAAVIDLAEVAAARAAAETVEVVETAPPAAAEAAREAVEAFTLEAEDLTRMVGIGPKLAAALAERGVTRFSHIAAWTDSDLLDVDKALDLKGRAVRDAWVAQAKRFAAEA